MYTSEQNLEINQAKIRLRRTGKPEIVQRIDLAVAEEAPFSKVQALYKISKIKPEVEAVKVLDHPPFSGKGSGQNPWRKFAKQVSDMDPDIIDSMSKTDLIKVLEDKGVITK